MRPRIGSEPGFESDVVTLDAIVGVLIGVVERVRDELLDDRLQHHGQVGDDLFGFAVRGQRHGEECACRCDVAPG